ncbi:MAG: hypothetical protein CM15mP9_1480 [Methanobacteriota archaeon]|nr:MAG: hypothetical protein CM15mP9_1480 [Euryarchaeota archaeon]
MKSEERNLARKFGKARKDYSGVVDLHYLSEYIFPNKKFDWQNVGRDNQFKDSNLLSHHLKMNQLLVAIQLSVSDKILLFVTCYMLSVINLI